MPCALNLNRKFSMEELIDLVWTSRNLLDAVRQVCAFVRCMETALHEVLRACLPRRRSPGFVHTVSLELDLSIADLLCYGL